MGAHGGLPAISTDNLNANHHDSGGNDRDVLDSRVLSKKSSDGKPMFLLHSSNTDSKGSKGVQTLLATKDLQAY